MKYLNNFDKYYYINDEDYESNKEWKYISFLNEIELDTDNFTNLIGSGGCLDADDEAPARNETVTRKTCYDTDITIKQAIKQAGLREITKAEYECAQAIYTYKKFNTLLELTDWCKEKDILLRDAVEVFNDYAYECLDGFKFI